MSHPPLKEDRLDAWYDGSAICVIAIGSNNAPLDLTQHEVEVFIAKLQTCLEESRATPDANGLDFS